MHTGTHIVWDWNGTLFHDNEAVIRASNAAFAAVGLEPITLEKYRELYCIPIPKFYERLMGRLPTPAEWTAMDGAFHQHYERYAVDCRLTEGVELLLAGWQEAGRSQSILSMAGHEQLVPLVSQLGIAERFVRVDGRTGPLAAARPSTWCGT